MIGWEQLFMGKMARGWRQCWLEKTYWRSGIAFTFMGWGRACWGHCNCTLYVEWQDKYKMTRLWLTTEVHAWMGAPTTDTLIPLKRDQWKWKLLKKAANLEIAYLLEHNIIPWRCVRKVEVTNILMTMIPQEELEQADNSFFAKIIWVKWTTVQYGRTDDGVNDPAERNEEPPD